VRELRGRPRGDPGQESLTRGARARRHRRGRRPRLRLHERLPRHCERRRDVRLDARADSADGGADRGARQLGGRVRDDRRREDGGEGRDRHRARDAEDRPCRADRRDHLEPAHVVVGTALVVVARADRRPDRRGRGAVGYGRRAVARRHAQGADPGARRTDDRVPCGCGGTARDLLDLSLDDTRRRDPHVPARPAGVRDVVRVHARRERRAEDDGRDRARAPDRWVPRRRRAVHPDLGEDRGRGRDRGRDVRRWLADHAHARPARDRRRPRAGPSSTSRRTSATRSRRRTRSRAR
jgi:hypothetical protein